MDDKMPGTNYSLEQLFNAHHQIKKRDTLTTTYLLTLPDGITFDIMRRKGRNVAVRNFQAILRYEKADDVRKLQSLKIETIVMLNGKLKTLREAYRDIGTDYIPTATYIGKDDSDEIYSELLAGRGKAMEQHVE